MILDQIKIIEIMIFDLIWSVSDQIFQYSVIRYTFYDYYCIQIWAKYDRCNTVYTRQLFGTRDKPGSGLTWGLDFIGGFGLDI